MTATENVQTVLGNAVVAKWNGKKMKACHGLAFYWAKANYWKGTWSVRDVYVEQVAWGTATGWIGFLDAYHGV